MQSLNFQAFQFRITDAGDRKMIFDRVRKKFVVLTPEEWVRQHMISYLVELKSVPASMIGVEKQLLVNGLVKRFDIAVFAREGNPLLLVECKAPAIEIVEKTFDQAARYNMQLKVKYFLITNGLDHFCCRIDYSMGAYVFIEEVPSYADMVKSV